MNVKATMLAIALAIAISQTTSAVVNVQLNLRYDCPADESMGGTWELLAGSDGGGIAGLSVLIDNINNDAVAAGLSGFSVFASQQVVTVIEVVTGHDANGLANGAFDIGLGAGTTGNVPDDLFPGNSPAIWANNALLASGTFGATRPSFLPTFGTLAAGANEFSGSSAVAATLGTLTVRGDGVATDGLSLGDANRDGMVDGLDTLITLSNQNQPGGWDQGDFDCSQFVDAADLAVLVPEPTTLVLVSLALATCAGLRNRN